MQRDPFETFDGLIDTSRRGLLKALTVGSITSVAMPRTATASEDTEITIRQGGQKVATVSPITTDRSVENFYRYDEIEGASANTPMNLRESGASKLFFYRQSGSGNPLSLVVIHDAPNDGSGGNVRFDFQPNSLPSGSWAVKDDPWESYSRMAADWGWSPCCTDGGAFRGSFTEGTQVTIDPSFEDGIGTWDLLDGDGSVAASLSLTDPVTLTVESGRTDGPVIAEQKRALAGHIDDISPNLEESDSVEATLEALIERTKAGELDPEVAADAITRMKHGENISEFLLASFGPVTVPDSERSGSLIGIPEEYGEYNIASLLVQVGISWVVEALLTVAAYLRVARSAYNPGSIAKTAISKGRSVTRTILNGLFDKFPTIKRAIRTAAEDINDDTLDVIQNGVTDGSTLAAQISDSISHVRDSIANDIVGIYETSSSDYPFSSDDVGTKLEDLNEAAGGADGEPDLGGGNDVDVEAIADSAIEEIDADLDLVTTALNGALDTVLVVSFLSMIAQLAALAGGIISISITLIQAATIYINLTITSVAGIGALGAMADQLSTHNQGINAIIAGDEEVSF